MKFRKLLSLSLIISMVSGTIGPNIASFAQFKQNKSVLDIFQNKCLPANDIFNKLTREKLNNYLLMLPTKNSSESLNLYQEGDTWYVAHCDNSKLNATKAEQYLTPYAHTLYQVRVIVGSDNKSIEQIPELNDLTTLLKNYAKNNPLIKDSKKETISHSKVEDYSYKSSDPVNLGASVSRYLEFERKFTEFQKEFVYSIETANKWTEEDLNSGNQTALQVRENDAIRVIKEKTGVCRNTANLVSVWLDELGIENRIVHILLGGVGHACNIYKGNEGNWYIADLVSKGSYKVPWRDYRKRTFKKSIRKDMYVLEPVSSWGSKKYTSLLATPIDVFLPAESLSNGKTVTVATLYKLEQKANDKIQLENKDTVEELADGTLLIGKGRSVIDAKYIAKLEAFGKVLRHIKIAGSVEVIEGFTAKTSRKLKIVTFEKPENLKKIGNYAFSNYEKLESIDLSGCINLEDIGNEAFQNCYLLKSIDLSKTKITALNNSVFYNCKSLKEVLLPPTLTVIDSNSMQSCNLKKLDLSNTRVSLIKRLALAYNYLLTDLKLPNNPIKIDRTAFVGDWFISKCIDRCSLLFSSNLQSSILKEHKKLSKDKLKDIYFYDPSQRKEDIDKTVSFDEKTGFLTVGLDRREEITSKYISDLYYLGFDLQKVKIPENIEIIREDSFRNIKQLKVIDFSNAKNLELIEISGITRHGLLCGIKKIGLSKDVNDESLMPLLWKIFTFAFESALSASIIVINFQNLEAYILHKKNGRVREMAKDIILGIFVNVFLGSLVTVSSLGMLEDYLD